MSLAALRGALTRLAVGCALVAGLLLLAAVAVTTASVLRGAFGRPILGDSEIVEMLLGVAVVMCMPLCEMKGAHVVVDFFTQKLPPRGLAGLDAVMRVVVAVVVAVLAWRLAIGGYNMWDRERDTMFLQLPFWWGYAGAALGMMAWSLCAAFVAAESLIRPRRPA
ncbi:TRAP transporter small permease [Falsiroseomonas sp. E2-1-a4]|uniref:TRAP transporter small permease n=1 Tax=Falsiroseomonas sp. E2-1-a4 TaxID=3239299 RepID=UPI003F2DD90D